LSVRGFPGIPGMSFPIPEFPGMKNPHGNGIPSNWCKLASCWTNFASSRLGSRFDGMLYFCRLICQLLGIMRNLVPRHWPLSSIGQHPKSIFNVDLLQIGECKHHFTAVVLVRSPIGFTSSLDQHNLLDPDDHPVWICSPELSLVFREY